MNFKNVFVTIGIATTVGLIASWAMMTVSLIAGVALAFIVVTSSTCVSVLNYLDFTIERDRKKSEAEFKVKVHERVDRLGEFYAMVDAEQEEEWNRINNRS